MLLQELLVTWMIVSEVRERKIKGSKKKKLGKRYIIQQFLFERKKDRKIDISEREREKMEKAS